MITNRPAELLKHLPVFKVCSEEELDQLGQRMTHRVFDRHSLIYEQGQASRTLYFLVKGTVKRGSHSVGGREIIKEVLSPITMFGELGMVGEERRSDFAMAMNDEVHILSLSLSHLRWLLQRNHNLAMNFLQWVGTRLRHTERRLESMVTKDARERIIDFILESARKNGKRVGLETLVRHCLTQQDIANMTGTSRQTVTSVLNELKRNNLIYFNRRSILIRDLDKLS
mgnify:FL=1